MKRYKLLKDLPMFKAGDLFYISEYGALIHDGGDVGVTAYARQTLEKFPDILTEWFEEIQEESTNTIHRKPRYGEDYWFVDDTGCVTRNTWDDHPVDHDRWDFGNTYLTEEAAEKAAERKRAIATLEMSSDFEPDWKDDDQEKWCILYDYASGILYETATYCFDYGAPAYYETREAIRESVKKYKKEWLAYFGIKG